MRHILPLLAAALLCASCCLLRGHKSSFANTQWTSSYETFVADAGTETTTVTLSLGPKNEFVLDSESHLPAHSAMYVNADGTVDTIPASTRQYSERGTYEVKSDAIVLTAESGAVHRLDIVSGQLKSKDLSFQELVFTRKTGR